MKTIGKFVAGVAAILFALWGLDSISDALFVPYTTLLTGSSGLVICLARCSQDRTRHGRFALASILDNVAP
jgi:hypothetical protein